VEMVIKKVSILLPLFIFGITPHVWPDSIKSMNNTANPLATMKMDANDGAVQKKMESVEKTAKPLIESRARSQPALSYSDDGAMMDDTKQDVNFSKAVEKKKKSSLTECLDKVIFSYNFVQNVWNDRFSYVVGAAEARSSNPEVSQSHLGSYPPGKQYFEEGRVLATFKFLHPKREELFKEIFMGFRFSFNPLSGHMFLDMNANPSSEARTGIIIPF
jgi:hypothetical protein